jgi:hypothetical protein
MGEDSSREGWRSRSETQEANVCCWKSEISRFGKGEMG